MEHIIMQLITNGGDAKSFAMRAIALAKEGKINEARELIEKSKEALNKAHKFQTELIQNEANGNSIEVSLLLVHAQDHLMNAITVKDLAKEMVDMYEKFL